LVLLINVSSIRLYLDRTTIQAKMSVGCTKITGVLEVASFYTIRCFCLCRAKFLIVKEDLMLLAVGIISTSAFMLNPEHWKKVQSFPNKLALHVGKKGKVIYV